MAPLSIAGLQDAYRSGRSSPVAVAEDCLARAAATDGVFIALTRDRALHEAAASEARWRAGRPLSPLDGIPVTWKDLFDVAGLPTTAGSRSLPQRRARSDAAAVARLARLGAVCIGKTNLSEFAFSGLGMNPWYGTPRNPRGPAQADHVCGGSSCGAAASVALGLCAVAIGTDTSGSVRVPAAFTGLYGWKPTRAAWPMAGVRGLAPSLDALGVIANSVEDAALVHATLAVDAAAAPASEASPLRTVIADEPLFQASEAAPRDRGLDALRRLEAQGIRVELRSVPEFRAAAALFEECGTLVAAEAFRRYRSLLDGPQAAGIDPLVRQRLEAARSITAAQYRKLKRAQAQLSRSLQRQWPRTVFAFPTAPFTAPRIADVAQPERYALVNARALHHTMLGSFLDLPGMAVPTGVDGDGLPTSLLLSAAPGNEPSLLEMCRALPSDADC